MRKVIFFVILPLIIAGCATTKPMGNPDMYLEKSIKEILGGVLTVEEAYLIGTEGYTFLDDTFLYKIVTNAYLNEDYILHDGEGNEIDADGSSIHDLYRISDNPDFNPNKKYRVKYLLEYKTREKGNFKKLMRVELESIEELLPHEEARRIAQEEEQRVKAAEKAARLSGLEDAFQEAVESGNPDTIMQFIYSDARALPYDWDEKDEIYNLSRLAIAKLITKNENVQLEGISQAINPYAFDTTKVYFNTILYVRQFLDRKIIAELYGGYSSSDDEILLQNIPNLTSISSEVWNVFLKYVGVTTLRLANGGIKEIATFDVLYHYQN